MPNGKRDWNQSGGEASLARNGSEKLLVRVDARAAELDDHRRRVGSPPAAAEHRIDWKLAEELEDGSEKHVVRSEHHRRADEQCIGERGADGQFAFAAL